MKYSLDSLIADFESYKGRTSLEARAVKMLTNHNLAMTLCWYMRFQNPEFLIFLLCHIINFSLLSPQTLLYMITIITKFVSFGCEATALFELRKMK